MQTAIPRFNLSEGAAVNKCFFESAKLIGKGNYDDIMKIIYNENEIKLAKWYWKSINVAYPEHIYVYCGQVAQRLRFSQKQSIHYETWIYGLFKCKDNVWRLSPLKRDSDFQDDIIEKLQLYTIRHT